MSRGQIQVMLTAIVVCIFAADAQQAEDIRQIEFKATQSVFVMAVKTSSQVENVLGDRYFRNVIQASCDSTSERTLYRGSRQPQSSPGPKTLERSALSGNPLISTDPLLKTKIEDEFRAQKKFRIAPTAEGADFVFFAFSKYPAIWIQASNPDPATGESAKVAYGSYGDSPYSKQLVQVFVFVMPAAAYMQVRKDVLTLSDAAQWQGYANGMGFSPKCTSPAQQSAARALVKKFHDEVLKKQRSERPPAANRQAQVEAEKKRAPDDKRSVSDLPSAAGAGTTIKVDTSLVVVPLTVLDGQGQFTPDLARRDFHVFEDDVEQEISHFSSAEAPFSVALLLDTSSSMSLRHEDVRSAAGAFAAQLQDQDRLMVVSLNSEVYVNAEFTGDRAQLEQAIGQTRAGGGTRLFDALDLVLTERLSRVVARKAIVLFTDGVDTESRLADASRSLKLSEESGALIYTIHYDTSTDVPVAPGSLKINGRALGAQTTNASAVGMEAYRQASQYLADLPERTGARAYQAKTIDELRHAFLQIAEDLRQQYEIGYYPINASHDGSYRHIRVQVDRPNVTVRARPGYRAALNRR
ncbi:MAG: VWA domain-containing protein [Acidobacteriia bacterium]|nr:VWA domain-containing protein [Terriglobia bacterium]